MDRIKLNQKLPFTPNNTSLGSCSSGTTGVKESLTVENIPNVGETRDAPTNSPANWSAENPFDK